MPTSAVCEPDQNRELGKTPSISVMLCTLDSAALGWKQPIPKKGWVSVMTTDHSVSSSEDHKESKVSNPYKDEIVISWPELHRDARYLSKVLDDIGDWKGIIAITRGGLVPAALVARELEIRLIDTVCVVSYGAADAGAAEQSQGSLRWLKGVEGDGTDWLLIDDLVDTGTTAKAVRERLPKAHFATLYAKPLGRPLVDTFVKEFKQDKWIYFPWDIDYRFVSPIKTRDGSKP